MRTAANDAALALMRALLPVGAAAARAGMRRRIARFAAAQQALRARYGIRPDTPICGYDDATRARVRALVAATPGARIATTSGTTGAPKELAYPPERLRLYRKDSIAGALGFLARLHAPHPTLFVLASQKTDDSFASLVLHTRRAEPPWLATLVEPSRALAHPRLRALAAELGADGLLAARVLCLAASDPGLLYATNPSTLVSFFTEVSERWDAATALVRRVVAGDLARDATLTGALGRIATAGADARLRRLAEARAPLDVAAWLPSLRGVVTWDGGYVTAFLPALWRLLPRERVAHVPMYAMSTEVIETLPVLRDGGIEDTAFLPLGPRVLYELLPADDGADDGADERADDGADDGADADDGARDDPARLIAPHDARPGALYALVVSDPWGLVRYQTDDVFLCTRLVDGLPDLRFVRRRGLAYSFTGEKLTGEQLGAAFASLRSAEPGLTDGVELSCAPSQPSDAETPRYVLLIAPASERAHQAVRALDVAALARALDDALSQLNAEWRDKRASGRLGAVRAEVVGYLDVAAALDRRTEAARDMDDRAWESQFKLNPLLRVRWEELAARLSRVRAARASLAAPRVE